MIFLPMCWNQNHADLPDSWNSIAVSKELKKNIFFLFDLLVFESDCKEMIWQSFQKGSSLLRKETMRKKHLTNMKTRKMLVSRSCAAAAKNHNLALVMSKQAKFLSNSLFPHQTALTEQLFMQHFSRLAALILHLFSALHLTGENIAA